MEFCFLIFCLAWWPMTNPVSVKLLFAPLLLFFSSANCKQGKFLFFLCSLLLICLLLMPGHHREFFLLEILCLWFYLFGLSRPKLELSRMLLILAGINTGFIGAWHAGWLPLHFFEADALMQDSLKPSMSCPGIFGNPSPMCLFFTCGVWFLRDLALKERLLYLLLTALAIGQSGSLIGQGLYIFSLFYLLRLSPKLLILVLACGLFYGFQNNNIQRSLFSRSILWSACLNDMNLIGHGPAGFQSRSGLILPAETNLKQISKNQIHPHNDLLYHAHSYGIAGFLIRLLFYAFCFFCIWQSKAWPLLFFLCQIQFTPDCLSHPASSLFFFALGQTSHHLFWSPLKTSLVYWPLCLIFFIFCLSLHNSHILNHHLQTKGQIPQEKPFFSSLPLHYNLIIACIQKGQTKEGLKYLNEIENIAPQFLDLPYLKARIYYEEGDLQKAVEQLHLMLKINPWHLYSISALADIYLRSGQTKKAAMLKNWRKKQEWRRLSGLAYSSP